MAKKKVEKPRREFTKRQLSRWQQQKRRQRMLFALGILIIVAVLGVIGAGIYIKEYLPNKPLHETVIEVNETKFDMEYFIKTLEIMVSRYEAYGISMSGEVISSLTGLAETAIEQNELIRQEAAKLGFTVSDEEVDKVLNSQNLPLNKYYRDIMRAQMLLERLRDEYFDKQVPTSAEQRHIWAMFLESESQVNEVKARLEAGEDFAELAGELSLDATSKNKKGDLDWRPEGVLTLTPGTSLVDEYAFDAEVGVLSQPICEETKTKMVGYWLIEVLSRDMEAKTASVRVILLGSEQEANEVRAKLEAGAVFATWAKELSQHYASKENGGAYEVTSEGMVSSAFDEFVFDPEVELETLSQPIRDEEVSTSGGCWLIKVTEIDNNRQISDDDRETLKSDALNKWVEGLSNNPENKVVSYLDEAKMAWALMYIIKGGQ